VSARGAEVHDPADPYDPDDPGDPLDPLGFVADELAARGALVDRGERAATALLPPPLAGRLALPELVELAVAPREDALGAIGCGLGSPLLDRLIGEVRARIPVAGVAWEAEPPRLGSAERLAGRIAVRNGVADLLGAEHAPATYLVGVLAWTAEADDRYEGMTTAIVHAGSGGEPDAASAGAMARLLTGGDPRTIDQGSARAGEAAAALIGARASRAIGPRLGEITAAVARRRDRERGRIEDYFTSLIAEARSPRRQVAPAAIEARVAALAAEQHAKLRDLTARYALRVRLEPVALAAVSTRAARLRLRLRRRKGERELTAYVPPSARVPDALACAACPGTTRAPVLCDDALHLLCEACAPEAAGRPRCPACRPRRGA
jgi:hypothetical protein